MAFQGHPRSLILAPTESAYATSYWSSIVTFGPILPRFIDIAGFLLQRATPPLFHPNFGGVPLRLDFRCCGSYRSEGPKLIIRAITFEQFEVTEPVRSRYINVTDRETDRRTTYDSNTALSTKCIAL